MIDSPGSVLMRRYFQPVPANVRFASLVLLGFFFLACGGDYSPRSIPDRAAGRIWFRQASVDLGKRISMLSTSDGFAISSGRGHEVPGRAYRYRNGRWESFVSFPYSDFPHIVPRDSTTVWVLHHLVHTGAYQPKLLSITHSRTREIPLPRIMWDAIDHVMWTGLSQLPNGTAWMVGQQGYTLFFDGTGWHEVKSPVMNPNRKTAYEGDLNDVFMLSPKSGWAVGRDGVILRHESGRWQQVVSPTHNNLNRVAIVNDTLGWCVGEKGTILRFDGTAWHLIPTNIRTNLRSVRARGPSQAWIVGDNSTLLTYTGTDWEHDESVKIFDDTFNDIDVVPDTDGQPQLWVIGNEGIYTTSRGIGFSFTDVTGQASLRRLGKGALFFDRREIGYPDLLVLNEEGPNLLYQNDGRLHFTDVTNRLGLSNGPRDATVIAIGDVDNDGASDILQLVDQRAAHLYRGAWSGSFRHESLESTFHGLDLNSASSARFIDFDNDGNLDLYISVQEARDVLLQGDGVGGFVPIGLPLGVAELVEGRSRGAIFSDFNNDGLIDVFIPYFLSVDGKFFDLFLNRGNFRFEPVNQSVLYSTHDLSPYSAIAHDFNNDGHSDILVYCQKAPPLLLMNRGDATFEDRSAVAGFRQIIFHPDPINGVLNAADVNNDGWTDVFISSHLFLNSPTLQFTEVSEQTGLSFIGSPSFADVDADGDVDLFLGSARLALGKGDRAALLRNNARNYTWLKVRVLGDKSNRMGLGSRIFITPEGAPAGRTFMQEVGLGSSPLLLQNISEVHFGLPADTFCTVRVRFPSGVERIIRNVRPRTTLEVRESHFPARLGILFARSVERTLHIIRWPVEIPKMILAAAIILGFLSFGRRIGAGNAVAQWYTPPALAMVYLILLHLTISNGQVFSSAIAFGGLALVNSAVVFLGRIRARKRSETYISHYRLAEQIGRGGMGRVFRAIDTNSKETVALKILHPELLNDPENRRRLAREGHLLSRFSHPNIVRVFEVADSFEQAFIAMEFLPGGTLKRYVEQSHPVPLSTIKSFLLQIADGLGEIHRNTIVHRDLKTANIMMDAKGTLRIMDFGISRSPLVTTMTSLGTAIGTLSYVAPEQITNINPDHRSDIFSFGVVAYELLTNTLPFKGENEIALIHAIFNTTPAPPSTLRPDVPDRVDSFVLRCLAKDPSGRFQTIEEVRLAVEEDFP
jgi:hypothetical protein